MSGCKIVQTKSTQPNKSNGVMDSHSVQIMSSSHGQETKLPQKDMRDFSKQSYESKGGVIETKISQKTKHTMNNRNYTTGKLNSETQMNFRPS